MGENNDSFEVFFVSKVSEPMHDCVLKVSEPMHDCVSKVSEPMHDCVLKVSEPMHDCVSKVSEPMHDCVLKCFVLLVVYEINISYIIFLKRNQYRLVAVN